jgi:hypothetical protein
VSIVQGNLFAQPIQLLDSQKIYYNIGKSIWIFKDKTQQLIISQVSSPAFAGKWAKAKTNK